jgi:hypothetical protein
MSAENNKKGIEENRKMIYFKFTKKNEKGELYV